MLPQVVVVQRVHLEHRQPPAVLVADPLGPVRHRVARVGLIQLQPSADPSHQPAQRLVVPARADGVLVLLRRIVERHQLELLVARVAAATHPPASPPRLRPSLAPVRPTKGLLRFGHQRNLHAVGARDQTRPRAVDRQAIGRRERRPKKPATLGLPGVLPLGLHDRPNRLGAQTNLADPRQVFGRMPEAVARRFPTTHLPNARTVAMLRDAQPHIQRRDRTPLRRPVDRASLKPTVHRQMAARLPALVPPTNRRLLRRGKKPPASLPGGPRPSDTTVCETPRWRPEPAPRCRR